MLVSLLTFVFQFHEYLLAIYSTVSDIPRTDFTSIEDYFVNFLKLKPQGEILESHVTIGQNWCQDAGIYEVRVIMKVCCIQKPISCSINSLSYIKLNTLSEYMIQYYITVHHGCIRSQGKRPLLLHLRIRR